MIRRRISVLLMLLILMVYLTTGCTYEHTGAVIEPPKPIVDFELPAHDGSTFQLSEYEGQIVLVYFGYTFCPDVCPTTMFQLKRAMEQLGNGGQDVQVVMVSVDPARDTADRLGEYVTNFDPDFIGLRTDDLELLDTILADFGAFYEIADVEEESEAGYLVNHTASVFVLNREGDMRALFPFGMTGEEMADDLKHLLRE